MLLIVFAEQTNGEVVIKSPEKKIFVYMYIGIKELHCVLFLCNKLYLYIFRDI